MIYQILYFYIKKCLKGISQIKKVCYIQNMEFRTLRYFLMVAQEENITRAAELLHITQPTLSRQLSELEKELGTELFERRSHKIHLTKNGLLLKRSAQELVELEEKTRAQFACDTGSVTGQISLGCGELQSMDELLAILREFRESYPGISINIITGIADDIKDQMEKGLLDFALLLEPVDVSSYDFVRMKTKEKWCAFVPEDSPLAHRQVVHPQDLRSVPLILPKRGNIKNEVINWLGCSPDTLNVAGTSNLTYNGATAARNGLGISISVDLNCKYYGVETIPLQPPLEHGSVLAWKRGLPSSKAVERFIEFIRK